MMFTDALSEEIARASERLTKATRSQLPHVGLAGRSGSMYAQPVHEPVDRSPIRVQATVGEPVREIEAAGG